MHAGFAFEVLDLKRSPHLTLVLPEGCCYLLMLIGAPHVSWSGRYARGLWTRWRLRPRSSGCH